MRDFSTRSMRVDILTRKHRLDRPQIPTNGKIACNFSVKGAAVCMQNNSIFSPGNAKFYLLANLRRRVRIIQVNGIDSE